MGSNPRLERKRIFLFASKLGYQTRSFNEAAQRLGVELVFVTDRCHQLDDPWGDRAIAVHFESPERAAYEVLQVAHGGVQIDGILALGDRPGVAAAHVARGLGLPYNHPASVEACRSKLRMREVFRDAGLRVPWFRSVPLQPAPEPALLGITYPCVLKPLSLSASQGVVRANNREEFVAATERIRRLLSSPEIASTREPTLDQILVEGYILGKEVAVEGLLTDGALRILAIFDKPDPLQGPFFEETIYVTPSRLPQSQQDAIERCAVASVRALGLSHGPVHAEFRIDSGHAPNDASCHTPHKMNNTLGGTTSRADNRARDNGAGTDADTVWPLEVAPRPIGGLCARALRFVNSLSGEHIGLEELLLRYAAGLPANEWSREEAASGVMMIPVPQSGVLERVEGQEAARTMQSITELHITARLGDYIAAWPEGSSYLGFLFARGGDPGQVENALRQAHAQLRFTLTPRLPVEHPATHRIVS
jgi:biotin carboxylase